MTQLDMLAVDELVREIARALVDAPDAVQVESDSREENTVLRLKVAPQDVGKVIGKQGRTARSVRTILGAVSMKLHHRYTLDILEEDEDFGQMLHTDHELPPRITILNGLVFMQDQNENIYAWNLRIVRPRLDAHDCHITNPTLAFRSMIGLGFVSNFQVRLVDPSHFRGVEEPRPVIPECCVMPATR